MIIIIYTIFLVMCSVKIAHTPEVQWVQVCGNCITYHPQHWQEDNFPAIIMFRNVSDSLTKEEN